MKSFLEWRTENHAILVDIQTLLYDRAVSLCDSDFVQADRIKEFVFQTIEDLPDASDGNESGWTDWKTF